VAFPARIPGLKALTALVALCAVIWVSLEGGLAATVGLAAGLALLATGHLSQRAFGGRSVRPGPWLAAAATAGLLLGVTVGGLTLALMALKTGLHAHGPEFTRAEFAWVLGRTPLWALAGLFAGLGVGLLGRLSVTK
jgi:hypothetical protein